MGRRISPSCASGRAVNALERRTPRGYTIIAEYDASGRVIRRVAPQVSEESSLCGWTTSGITCNYSMPTRGSGVCFDAETSVFSYDAAGNMVRADNDYARVRRTYTPAGLVSSDLLLTRK